MFLRISYTLLFIKLFYSSRIFLTLYFIILHKIKTIDYGI